MTYSCSISVSEDKISSKNQISSHETTRVTTKGFTVSGTKLLDGNNQIFEIRGINHAHAWYKGEEVNSIQGIAKTRANTVRIALGTGNKWVKDDASTVLKLINLAKDNNMIAILEVHDATGSDSKEDLADAVDYFISLKDILIGQEAYVLINIANEWYGSWDSNGWANGYINQIPRLREAGLTHTLIVDAAGWGQYPTSIFRRGQDVLAADSLGNTMFSIHMYEYAGGSTDIVKNNIDSVLDKGLALIIGEFGIRHTNGDVDEATIMSYCKTKGVGWLAWSWFGNTVGEFDYLDISSDWQGTAYSQWGQIVVDGVNGLNSTSNICSVFSTIPDPDEDDGDTGEAIFNYAIIDNFDSRSSSDFLRNSNGNSISAEIVTGLLKLDYTIDNPSYAGMSTNTSVTGILPTYDTVKFTINGDNSGRDLIIQFKESNGEYFETSYVIGGTETAEIPVSTFHHPSWYSGGNGILDFSEINQYSFYIQNGTNGSGSIKIDDFYVGCWDVDITDNSGTVDITLEYANDNCEIKTNAIKPKVRINNIGNSEINLSNVKFRYWYTNETQQPQVGTIYWTNVNTSTISTLYGRESESDYMEFSFSEGVIPVGGKVEINPGINASNWSMYNQGNDFSFKNTGSTYVENFNITAYINGTLVWGTPPSGGNLDKPISPIYITDPIENPVSSDIDYGGSEGEDVGVVWASWNPAHFSGTSYTHFMDKVDEYGIKRVTLIPTYFIDTYTEGIRYEDWENTPNLELQSDTIIALINKGVRINFRPHIDPLQFSWSGASSTSTDPGTLGWRGVFSQLDPMNQAQNYKKVMINSLEVLKNVITAIDEAKLKEPIRFDLGAELMESTKQFSPSWVNLLAFVRHEIDVNYPELKGKVILGHNFCHHIEYLERLPNHYNDYFARVLGDGDVDSNRNLLFVDDMQTSNKKALAEYIKGLDTFSVSQYMPMDIFGSEGSTTPENVRDALLEHETNLLNEILGAELGITREEMPPFQIGEYGMGIRGLAAPNVWDRAEWVDAGHEDALISYDEHQIHAKTAIDGLLLYMKDPRSVANSFQIWMSGAPYDILDLNPTFSTGDSGHGYPGFSSYNDNASNALKTYWAQ